MIDAISLLVPILPFFAPFDAGRMGIVSRGTAAVDELLSAKSLSLVLVPLLASILPIFGAFDAGSRGVVSRGIAAVDEVLPAKSLSLVLEPSLLPKAMYPMGLDKPSDPELGESVGKSPGFWHCHDGS